LGVERIRLDQQTAQIQVPEEHLERCPLMILTLWVTGLSDCHAQCCRVERDLGNEGLAATSLGLDGDSQGLSVTHQLIKIRCNTWDLNNRPVSYSSAD